MSSTFNYGITSTGLGQSTSTPSSVWPQLGESKEFREEFNALQLKRGVAFQIRALLKARGWKQAELAAESKLTQGVVSRAQDPNYGNLTINTINRIANGFDVAFIGEFVPFSELVRWFENLSEEIGNVESFEKEYRQFLRGKIARPRKRSAKKKRLQKAQRRVRATLSEGQMMLRFDEAQTANVIQFPSNAGEGSSIPNPPLAKVAAAGAGGQQWQISQQKPQQ